MTLPSTPLSTDAKRAKLRELADLRKAEPMVDALAGFRNVHEYHDGKYDQTDHVSPWSRSADNVDADCLIFLQDWSSDEILRGPWHQPTADFGHAPERRTNKQLIHYVDEFLATEISSHYVTNVFPFIKTGSISAGLKRNAVDYAAKKFAAPQVEIIRPKLVICAGNEAFNALRRLAGLADIRMREALGNSFEFDRIPITVVPHPSRPNRIRDERHWTHAGERLRQLRLANQTRSP